MLKHYSHIRMEAKPTAPESIVQKQAPQPTEREQDRAPVTTVTQQIEGQYPQKSHSLVILERYVDGRWIVNDEKNWLPERYTKEILGVQRAGDGRKLLIWNTVR
jgi:hypothetical protein